MTRRNQGRPRLFHHLFSLLALGAMPLSIACEPLEEGADNPPTAVTASLSGNTTFTGDSRCFLGARDARVVAAIGEAGRLIRHADMPLCLMEHFMSGTRGWSPEAILRRMQDNVFTKAECRDVADPDFGTALAEAPVGISGEMITFDNAYLDGTSFTVGEAAPAVLHEIAHNKGFVHGTNGHLSDEYSFTVPEVVRNCAAAIFAGRYVSPYGLGAVADSSGAARGQLGRGTMLAAAGSFNGSLGVTTCGNKQFARGLRGRNTSSTVTNLVMVCGDVAGGFWGHSPQVGAATGTTFNLDCGTGNILVGVQGYADSRVNDVAPLCKTAADANAGTGGVWAPGHAGVLTGDFYWRQCPNGMAVTKLHVRSSSGIDRLVLECERLTEGSTQAAVAMPVAGTAIGTPFRERCPAGSVMTALTGRSGSRLDRLGGMCRPVTKVVDSATGTRWVKTSGSANAIHLEAYGGWGGDPWTTDACDDGKAMIGIDYRAGSRIDRIRGVCADAVKWSDERGVVGAVPIQGMRLHGGTGGSDIRAECPREYFLQGWDLYTDGSANRIEAFCIRAED